MEDFFGFVLANFTRLVHFQRTASDRVWLVTARWVFPKQVSLPKGWFEEKKKRKKEKKERFRDIEEPLSIGDILTLVGERVSFPCRCNGPAAPVAW
tara:strand:- start:363 stop:650 length:288 start_codon:yes stop_codon:yes gene_type:complete